MSAVSTGASHACVGTPVRAEQPVTSSKSMMPSAQMSAAVSTGVAVVLAVPPVDNPFLDAFWEGSRIAPRDVAARTCSGGVYSVISVAAGSGDLLPARITGSLCLFGHVLSKAYNTPAAQTNFILIKISFNLRNRMNRMHACISRAAFRA